MFGDTAFVKNIKHTEAECFSCRFKYAFEKNVDVD